MVPTSFSYIYSYIQVAFPFNWNEKIASGFSQNNLSKIAKKAFISQDQAAILCYGIKTSNPMSVPPRFPSSLRLQCIYNEIRHRAPDKSGYWWRTPARPWHARKNPTAEFTIRSASCLDRVLGFGISPTKATHPCGHAQVQQTLLWRNTNSSRSRLNCFCHHSGLGE